MGRLRHVILEVNGEGVRSTVKSEPQLSSSGQPSTSTPSLVGQDANERLGS